MEYLELETKGYKRFALNNIEYFKLKPNLPIQLILGTNGSGKSSLLNLLSPLPADAKNFRKGGSLSIKIRYKDSIYKLVSDFTDGSKFYFYKDDENLNTGRTISVQRELVREHFNYTEEIHKLRLGKIRFTKMSPNERRYWLTKFSDTDFTYPIQVFNKLKENHRDVTGALKLTKQRLVVETSKLLSEKELDNVREDITEYEKLIEFLQANRNNKTSILSEQELNEEINRLESFLNNFKKGFSKLSSYGDLNLLNDDQIDTEIIELEKQLAIIEDKYKQCLSEFESISDKVNLLKHNKDKDIETLVEQKNILLQELQDANRAKVIKSLELEDPESCLRILNNIYNDLSTTLLNLPTNPDKKYSKLSLETNQNKLREIKEKTEIVSKLLSENLRISEKQIAALNSENISCPSCFHEWKLGYEEKVHAESLEKLSSLQENIDELTSLKQEAEDNITEILDYFEKYRQFNYFVNSFPILKDLWSYLLEDESIFINPSSLNSKLITFSIDLELNVKENNLKQKIDSLTKDIQTVNTLNSDGTKELLEHSLKLEKLLGNSTSDIVRFKSSIDDLRAFKILKNNLLILSNKLEITINNVRSKTDDVKENLTQQFIYSVLRESQIQLGNKQKILSEINILQSLITDLKNQIHILEQKENSLKILINELSPTDGLIAEGMLGFIKKFTSKCNSVISDIWSYPLIIKPCGVNSEESGVDLDYRFPFTIKDNNEDIPDIADASTAQGDIIDLAFVICAMERLGLGDAPIMLDEFGASFDAVHRDNAIDVVKALVDIKPFSQLFMVNHYESSYGAMTNAEVCVLCSSNIIIPSGVNYNEHVIME